MPPTEPLRKALEYIAKGTLSARNAQMTAIGALAIPPIPPPDSHRPETLNDVPTGWCECGLRVGHDPVASPPPTDPTAALRTALTRVDFDYARVHVGPESRRFNPDELAAWLMRQPSVAAALASQADDPSGWRDASRKMLADGIADDLPETVAEAIGRSWSADEADAIARSYAAGHRDGLSCGMEAGGFGFTGCEHVGRFASQADDPLVDNLGASVPTSATRTDDSSASAVNMSSGRLSGHPDVCGICSGEWPNTR